MSHFLRPALAVCLALAPVATAQAQDWRGTPVYGSVRLSAGFTPDPHEVNVTAGGSIDATNIRDAECVGMIGRNPDYVVNYSADDLSLYIRAESDGDTSLVVRDPRGFWNCDDDTNGLDPEVRFTSPRSGNYHIWVGTLADEPISATLSISELSGGTSGGRSLVDMSATATYGEVILRSGFTPDPHTVEIVSGGSIDASDVSSECRGMISSSPDYEVTYRDAGSFPLTFSFVSRGDTTLVINAPDGSWYCDDDSGGKQNPRVHFRDAMDGVYDIWVGNFGGSASGELRISEIDR